MHTFIDGKQQVLWSRILRLVRYRHLSYSPMDIARIASEQTWYVPIPVVRGHLISSDERGGEVKNGWRGSSIGERRVEKWKATRDLLARSPVSSCHGRIALGGKKSIWVSEEKRLDLPTKYTQWFVPHCNCQLQQRYFDECTKIGLMGICMCTRLVTRNVIVTKNAKKNSLGFHSRKNFLPEKFFKRCYGSRFSSVVLVAVYV